MFEQTFVDARTKSPYTVALSFFLQSILIVILVLIPLIYTETLKPAQLTAALLAPPPPPPPPPPPQPQAPKPKVIHQVIDTSKLLAPKTIPKQLTIIKEDEPPPSAGVVGGVAGGVPGGTAGGVLGGIIGGIPAAAPPPPPPPPPPKAVTPQRIRVGGNVSAANLIRKVTPVYPPLAKQARIQGTVRFTAIIGKDGTIQNLQLVSGHPLLVQAAQDAVRQWVYRPTLLNNEPVEVVTQIDVNFTLSQ
jgi:protein TonB